jgi:hypothetical protein
MTWVLGLDLSSHVGWAWGARGDRIPRTGVWDLPPPAVDIGRTFAAFENELLDRFTLEKPALVVMEAPLPPSGQTHPLTMRLQIGLAAVTACACYRWEIRLEERPASTVRAKVIGTGRFAKGQAKPIVFRWARDFGIPVADHNAADAAVLWLYETGYRHRAAPARRAA